MPARRVLPDLVGILREIDLELYGRVCSHMPAPDGLRPIPGEISASEGRVLYDLAAHVWRGDGNVLELGTLFGASTQWIGLGMTANRKRRGHLCAADAFLPYRSRAETVAQLEPLLGQRRDWTEIADGFASGFRPAFEALHARGQPYSGFLSVATCLVPIVPGDSDAELDALLREVAPIGLLVVDSVKAWYPVRALALRVVEHLLPGALVAWQDHRWFNSFGIPFLNERLSAYQELLAVVDGMHVYRYLGGADSTRVREAMPEDVDAVPTEELEDLFRQLAWRCYLRNDAYGVLSASLQLSFALAVQGHGARAQDLLESSAKLPGFASHEELFRMAREELAALPAMRADASRR
jgi:hypothetical protein